MGTMYKPQNNGPHTELAATINAGQTSITVTNASVLPEAPNVLTIGTEEDAELVEVQSITGNILTVQRGFNGTTAKAWDAGTWIYRGITAQDIEELQERTKKIVKTMTAEEFEALTTAEFAALYASGVRTVLVEQTGEEGSDTVSYRGYGLDVNGNAIPIADPDAIRKGDTVSKAEDAKMLGGKPASDYFLAENVGNLDCAKLELLWENAKIENEFAAQTVNVDSTNYDGLLATFCFTQNTANGIIHPYIWLKDSLSFRVVSMYGGKVASRLCTCSETGIQFDDAKLFNSYGASETTMNGMIIPKKIYGIKGALA